MRFFTIIVSISLLLISSNYVEGADNIGINTTGTSQKANVNDKTNTIKVGTRLIKPFVFMDEGVLTGFSVDLWRSIAASLGLNSQFDIHDTLDELLAAIEDGRDVAAISAISITSEREKKLDFSQPMFSAGLSIMIPKVQAGGLWGFLQSFSYADIFQFLLILFLLVAIPAHIIWFVERKNEDQGYSISKKYIPGIFDAAFWAISVLGGQVEGYPSHAISKIISVIWIYTSIIFIAYFTAFMTTTLTVQQLKGDISGPDDLKGKRVSTIKDSTASHYLDGLGAVVVGFDDIESAIQAMLDGKAVAVVYDSPILLYYSSNVDMTKVQMVQGIFHQESYGIAFPPGSPLRKTVNEALLAFREDGTYQTLYQKWFGSSQENK